METFETVKQCQRNSVVYFKSKSRLLYDKIKIYYTKVTEATKERSYALAIESHHLTSVFDYNLFLSLRKKYLFHALKPGFTVKKIA